MCDGNLIKNEANKTKQCKGKSSKSKKKCIPGWIDGWVSGWVDEWVGGWMDGWDCLQQSKT